MRRSSFVSLGFVLMRVGDVQGGRRVIAAASAVPGLAPRLTDAWLQLGEPQRALDAARDEIPQYRANRLSRVAEFLIEANKKDFARGVIDEAYVLADSLTSLQSPNSEQLNAYRQLSLLQIRLGDREAAKRRIMAMPGAGLVRLAEVDARQAEVLMALGEPDEAEQRLRAVIPSVVKMLPDPGGQRAEALIWIGVGLYRAGDKSGGLDVLRKLDAATGVGLQVS